MSVTGSELLQLSGLSGSSDNVAGASTSVNPSSPGSYTGAQLLQFANNPPQITTQPTPQPKPVQPVTPQPNFFQNLEQTVANSPITKNVIDFGKNAIEQVPKYVESAVKNPGTTIAGAGEATLTAFTTLGGLLEHGFTNAINNKINAVNNLVKNPTDIGNVAQSAMTLANPAPVFSSPDNPTIQIPQRFDLTEQTKALKELDQELLKTAGVDDQRAFATGQFLGTMVPYTLGGEVIGPLTTGILGPLTARFLPQATKFVPLISDAISFAGIGQIIHDDQDGSRFDQLKNDLALLSLFKITGFAFGKLSEGTKKLVGATADDYSAQFKNGDTIKVGKLESDIERAKTAIAEDTGKPAESVAAEGMTQIQPGEIKAVEVKPQPLTAYEVATDKTGATILKPQSELQSTTDISRSDVATWNRVQRQTKGLTEAGKQMTIDNELSRRSVVSQPNADYLLRRAGASEEEIARGRITVYRATEEGDILPGDYVSPDKNVIKPYFDQRIETGRKPTIESRVVDIRDLRIGDEPTDFVYVPQRPTGQPLKTDATLESTNGQIKSTPESQVTQKTDTTQVPKGPRDVGQSTQDQPRFPQTKENQGLPTNQASPNQAPLTPIGEGVVKQSAVGESVAKKALERRLADVTEDIPTFKQLNIEDQLTRAETLVKEDIERARRVALGRELPPEGLAPESVFVQLEKKAFEDGNISLIRELAASDLGSQGTAMGQRIRVLAERDPESVVAQVQKVQDARTKAVEQKTGRKVPDAISHEADTIKKEVKAPDKHDWQAFLDSIQC